MQIILIVGICIEMLTYPIIFIFTFIFLTISYILYFSKTVESLENNDIIPISQDTALGNSLNISSADTTLYTANNINYSVINTKIQYIDSELDRIKSVYDKISFKIGSVITSVNPMDKPKISIGGNYPENIILNFKLLPPKPGDAGEIGDDGITGPDGPRGGPGNRGINGGNGVGGQ